MALTKDQLREHGERLMGRTREVRLPEFGPDAAVVVRGYTAAETASITQAAMASGRHDLEQDRLLSIITCVVEPKLTLEDTDWIRGLPSVVVERILIAANHLSGRTVEAKQEAREFLESNPEFRSLLVACVKHFGGRLPSEINVSEAEFNLVVAALNIDAEEDAAI